MITDPLTIFLLPVTVFCGILAIVGVILKQTLRSSARKERDDHQPRLPHVA